MDYITQFQEADTLIQVLVLGFSVLLCATFILYKSVMRGNGSKYTCISFIVVGMIWLSVPAIALGGFITVPNNLYVKVVCIAAAALSIVCQMLGLLGLLVIENKTSTPNTTTSSENSRKKRNSKKH